MPESLGRRLALLRNQRGWTQQALADRLGLSRVAISHFEADLALPSERSVVLLAGLFRVEPHELVADTFYPQGKALRLPSVAPRYTEVELQLALFERDLHWLQSFPNQYARVYAEWQERLTFLYQHSFDDQERAALRSALAQLRLQPI